MKLKELVTLQNDMVMTQHFAPQQIRDRHATLMICLRIILTLVNNNKISD